MGTKSPGGGGRGRAAGGGRGAAPRPPAWSFGAEFKRFRKAYSAAAGAADASRIGRAVRPGSPPGPGDRAAEGRVLPIFWAAIAQRAGPAPGAGRGARGAADVAALCREGFCMLAERPLPGGRGEAIPHVLALLAFACAGERHEWMRGWLERNGRAWDARAARGSGRDGRLAEGIYRAVLLMARRSGGDLEAAAGILEGLGGKERPAGAGGRERASLLHLAEAAGLVCAYARRGSPADAGERADAHVEAALSGGDGPEDLDAVAAALRPAFRSMARNSLWTLARRAGGRPGAFAAMLAGSGGPASEMSSPQGLALLDGGLLGPARGTAVAVLPAPCGRTRVAEFRILRALESARGGTAAYAVPTAALAGRVTARLRRDLGSPPLCVGVEDAGGLPCAGGFEEAVAAGKIRADVLVATPEKLLAMLRHPGGKLAGSLALVVADWAHGTGGAGGLGMELLLAEVRDGCPRAGILVMGQSAPDARGMAKWLDPGGPPAIVPEPDPRQCERAVGVCVARGSGRTIGAPPAPPAARRAGAFMTSSRGSSIESSFMPLDTAAGTAWADAAFRAGPARPFRMPRGSAVSRRAVAALFAARLDPSMGALVLGRDPGQAWEIAETMWLNLPELEPDADRRLAARLVGEELGAGFPLVKYLGRGIGVYHPGLPAEVGEVMVGLMEGGRLRALAATTETAREIDFPVPAVVMASRSYRSSPMPARDFWNLAGWAGRIDGPRMGIVGLAAADGPGAAKWAEYAEKAAGAPASSLPGMVRGALEGGGGIDLRRLAEGGGDWAALARYVGRAAGRDPGRAAEGAVAALRRTYGYGKLRPGEREALEAAVGRYAGRPGGGAARLPGASGFPPEALEKAARALESAGIGPGGWSEGMFSPGSGKLPALLGAIESIPGARGDLEAAWPGGAAPREEVCGTVSDWVSGKKVWEIAAARFGGGGIREVATCAEAVRGLAAAVARGTAAAMGIQGYGPGAGGEAPDLPAMAYHGVGTGEAAIMRRHGVPRGAAPRVGEAYARERRDIRGGARGIMRWLEGLPGGSWGPGSGSGMSGADYKEVWRRLSGAGA